MGYFPDENLSSGILSSWDFFLVGFFPTWDFVLLGCYPDIAHIIQYAVIGSSSWVDVDLSHNFSDVSGLKFLFSPLLHGSRQTKTLNFFIII